MGGLLSRQKKENGGRKFYQFWVKEPQSAEINPKLTSGSTTKTEWTSVPLQTPDLPNHLKEELFNEVPVPPPRKHRGKNQSAKSIEELNITKEVKLSQDTPLNLIPVEEPIIIPKKEPIHICDGTHHHVTNIVNGAVIHDTHISPKINPPLKKEKLRCEKPVRPKNVSTVSLPNYEELSIKSVRPKHNSHKPNPKKKPSRHISILSLPSEGNKGYLSADTAARLENYMMRCKSFGNLPPKELLEKLQQQMEASSDSDDSWECTDDWDMEVIEHTISHSPLVPRSRINAPSNVSPLIGSHSDYRMPTTIEEDDDEKKVDKIVPAQNIQSKQMEENKESIFDKMTQPPQILSILPTKKQEARRESVDDKIMQPPPILSIIPVKKQEVRRDSTDDKILSPSQGIITTKKLEGRRESIEDNIAHPLQILSIIPMKKQEGRRESLDDKTLPSSQGIITSKRREGRRESIDDFFESKGENPLKQNTTVKKENYLGRRGSDGFFAYENKCFPFKPEENGPPFNSDKFFSNSLLQSESDHSQKDILLNQRRKSAGATLRHSHTDDMDDDEIHIKSVIQTFNTDDDLLNTFQKFYNKKSDQPLEDKSNDNTSDITLDTTHQDITQSPSKKVQNTLDTITKVDNVQRKSLTDDKKIVTGSAKHVTMVDSDKEELPKDDNLVKETLSIMSQKVNESIENTTAALSATAHNAEGELNKYKPQAIEHSGLLKFIQENSADLDKIDTDKKKTETYPASFPDLASAKSIVDDRLKKIEDETKESGIVSH